MCFYLTRGTKNILIDNMAVGIAQWLEHQTRDRKVAGAAGKFSSPWSTFCADFYVGIRSIPVLPKWHVKDPGHYAKSACDRLQPNTYAPYICGSE